MKKKCEFDQFDRIVAHICSLGVMTICIYVDICDWHACGWYIYAGHVPGIRSNQFNIVFYSVHSESVWTYNFMIDARNNFMPFFFAHGWNLIGDRVLFFILFSCCFFSVSCWVNRIVSQYLAQLDNVLTIHLRILYIQNSRIAKNIVYTNHFIAVVRAEKKNDPHHQKN